MLYTACVMFLRFNRRFKDRKEHCYWNIVEKRRCAGGKVVQRQVQRQVPHLGEINDCQRDAMAICGWWSGDNFERHVGCVAR